LYRYVNTIGHAILGNFNTDQMVIEFTKISKLNASKLQKNSYKTKESQEKPWMDKTGED